MRKSRSPFRRFAPPLRAWRALPASLPALAAVLVLLLGGAHPAEAQRACDAANPLMLCDVTVCIALQANVNSICKNPAPVSCADLSGCNVLKRERQHWLDCYTARTIINNTCWGGGDLGHQEAEASAITQVGVCSNMIALPQPVGCADPCP
jgi:hypothetical protein